MSDFSSWFYSSHRPNDRQAKRSLLKDFDARVIRVFGAFEDATPKRIHDKMPRNRVFDREDLAQDVAIHFAVFKREIRRSVDKADGPGLNVPVDAVLGETDVQPRHPAGEVLLQPVPPDNAIAKVPAQKQKKPRQQRKIISGKEIGVGKP